MDKILFLIYCLTNTLLYALIKFFHIHSDNHLTTLEVMSYANITAAIAIIPYMILNSRNIIIEFRKQSKLAVTVIASALKVYAIQYISTNNAMIITFTMPMFVILISLFTIEKYSDKISWSKYAYVPFSFIGVIIFIGSDAPKYPFVYAILILHVILRALVNIFIKNYLAVDILHCVIV